MVGQWRQMSESKGRKERYYKERPRKEYVQQERRTTKIVSEEKSLKSSFIEWPVENTKEPEQTNPEVKHSNGNNSHSNEEHT